MCVCRCCALTRSEARILYDACRVSFWRALAAGIFSVSFPQSFDPDPRKLDQPSTWDALGRPAWDLPFARRGSARESPMPQHALVGAVVESTPVAHALQAAGCAVKVGGSHLVADVTLPAKGGSLAFLICRSVGPDGIGALMKRADKAAKASRRCTVVWITADCPTDEANTAMQTATPSGVNSLWFASDGEAAEHMLACAASASKASERNLRAEDGLSLALSNVRLALRTRNAAGQPSPGVQTSAPPHVHTTAVTGLAAPCGALGH